MESTSVFFFGSVGLFLFFVLEARMGGVSPSVLDPLVVA